MSEDTLNLVLSRLTAMDTKIGALDTKIGTLDTKIAALDTKIAALDTKIGTLDTTIRILDSRMGIMEKRMGDVEARFTAVESKIHFEFSELNGRITYLDERIAIVEKGLSRIDLDLDDIRRELKSTRVGVMERIDRLQATVQATRDDVSTNFFRADVVERHAKNAVTEAQSAFLMAHGASDETRALSDQVNSMQRAIMTLTTRVETLEGNTDRRVFIPHLR